MKLCSGTNEEVIWSYINQPKCQVCKAFVEINIIEEADGFIDVARRHFAGGRIPRSRLGITNRVR